MHAAGFHSFYQCCLLLFNSVGGGGSEISLIDTSLGVVPGPLDAKMKMHPYPHTGLLQGGRGVGYPLGVLIFSISQQQLNT